MRISISGWWRGVGTGVGPPPARSSAGMGRRGGGRGGRLAPLLPFPSVLCPRECTVPAVALRVCVCLSFSWQWQALVGAGPALMATVATWPLPDSFFARNFSCPCFTTPGALGLGLAWRRRAHPYSPSRGDLPGGTGPSVPTTTGMLQCPTKAMSLCCCRWRGLSVGELCPKKCPNRQRRGALLYGISVKPPCNKCHWKELCVVLCRGNPSAHGITDQEGNPWSIMERKSNPRSITDVRASHASWMVRAPQALWRGGGPQHHPRAAERSSPRGCAEMEAPKLRCLKAGAEHLPV